jgi:hypothetical protein
MNGMNQGDNEHTHYNTRVHIQNVINEHIAYSIKVMFKICLDIFTSSVYKNQKFYDACLFFLYSFAFEERIRPSCLLLPHPIGIHMMHFKDG